MMEQLKINKILSLNKGIFEKRNEFREIFTDMPVRDLSKIYEAHMEKVIELQSKIERFRERKLNKSLFVKK